MIANLEVSALRAIKSAVLALIITAPPLGAQVALTADDWRFDVAFADSAMRSVHPAPYHREGKARFDAMRDALLRDLPRLDATQVAVRLMAWTSLLNDGHSGLRVPAGDRVYPIGIHRFIDGIFVVAARPEDVSVLRGRVLRIGNLSATAAWDSLQSIAAGDNEFSRMEAVPRLLTNPELLRALGLAPDGVLQLVVASPRGDTVRIGLRAVPRNGSNGRPLPMPGWSGSLVAVGRGASVALVEKHRSASYWYAVQDGVLYAQVNQVGNSADTVELGDSRAAVSFAGFSDSVMARIDRGGIERLVLDLRFNGGGNNGLVRPFVAGMAARAIGTSRGRFFVITGRQTYSAAMNFVSLLEDRTAALFVGEAPGGAPRHYGDAVLVVLPRSKLMLRLSTLEWDIGVGPRDIREVHEPDIPAPPRFTDLVRGIDAPLEAITAYRNGSLLGDLLLARYQSEGLSGVAVALDSIRRVSSVAGSAWESQVQQLLDFASAMIPKAKSRADIFEAYALITDRYPMSHVAWAERARAHGFVQDWSASRDAYQRALALRPANASLQRWLALTSRLASAP